MSVNACQSLITIRNEKAVASLSMCAWQKGSGNLLAIRFESIHTIFIYDRRGRLLKKIPIPTNCTGLEWDVDGDVLAIMLDTMGSILLWEAHSGRIQELETGLKEPGSVLAWSVVGKILAYGTIKGNIMVYNHRTMRKIPVLGKHTKKIVCAKWSKDEMLAFGTHDDQISINTGDGDLLRYLQLRGRPSDLQFGHIKEDHAPKSTVDNTISCIVADKTLYLLKYDDTSAGSPMELGFQARYGNLLSHHWRGDGYILVTFCGGFLVLLSSHYKEIGTELVLCELKEDILRCTALNSTRGWLATCCGAGTVQIHEASDPKIVLSLTEVDPEDGRLRPMIKCHWSDDGHLLAVCSTAGAVHLFLTAVPLLGGANFSQMAAMSSLSDCVLYSFGAGDALAPEYTFKFEIEPDHIVLGPIHLAAILHSTVWLYNTRHELYSLSQHPSFVKEFNSNVHDFVLNHLYCAARCGSKVLMYRTEGNGLMRFDLKTFPEQHSRGIKITCIAMAKDTFVYGTDRGGIRIFHLEQWNEIICLDTITRAPMKGIYPDSTGSQMIFVDKFSTGFFFDVLTPIASEAGPSMTKALPDFPIKCDGVIWDTDNSSRHIFVTFVYGNPKVQFFSGWRDQTRATEVTLVGNFDIGRKSDNIPINVRRGGIYSLWGSGKIHECLNVFKRLDDDEEPTPHLARLLNLHQYPEALAFCHRNPHPVYWSALALAATEAAELDVAMSAFAMNQNVGMSYSLRRIHREVEDLCALFGDVAMVLGYFDEAESRYLEVGHQHKALGLRRDLQEWDVALDMAVQFGSPMYADIAREYAVFNENTGDFIRAQTLYERARHNILMREPLDEEEEEEFEAELMEVDRGLARVLVRNGAHLEAILLLERLDDPALCRDCAELFEKRREYAEAAKQYEKCGEEQRAAACYIRLKEFNKAEPILVKENSSVLWRQYGHAKEAEGDLVEAARGYSKGYDHENGIRVYLLLDIPEEAGSLAKQSDDPVDALRVATYYQEKGLLEKALEYLVISENYEEAVLLAFKNGITQAYVRIVTTTFPTDLPPGFLQGIGQVALDFENKKDYLRAGKCYHCLGDSDKAFTLLMKAAQSGVQVNEEEVINMLIEAVIKSSRDNFGRSLVDLLLGEKDGIPKDPKYLYNYYLRAGKILEASKTAIIVAKGEQSSGNYREAHSIIIQTIRQLRSIEQTIPKDLIDNFNTIHCYKLVKALITAGDKKGAARMAIRLSDNLSQFAKAAAGLLTMGVTLCQQTGLKKSARELAFILMKNKEYRDGMDPKMKPMIEQLVRKTGKVEYEDEKEQTTLCPYCDLPVPEYSLICKDCKSLIPICILSGKHLNNMDLSACPKCDFPFNSCELLKYPDKTTSCLICEAQLKMSVVTLINDPRPYLWYLQ